MIDKKMDSSLSLDAVKSELSATALSEDEQAMVCEPVRVCVEQSLQGETVPNRRCAEGVIQFIFLKKLPAFTLAEILLSLSIIGIVAAIALPSLLGNVHERAFETQKKALYTRFSQAIPLLPSLNGYGQLEGTLSVGTQGQEGYVPQSVTVDTAAESFVRDGLSKVMKITNICDSEHLADCGLPDKIIPINGGAAISLTSIKSLAEFHTGFNGKRTNIAGDITYTYELLNTKAVAFETVNGESILAYYNPVCEPYSYVNDYFFAQATMCANFIYDLNGKKGPNTVGKDIGVITAFYSTDPVVVAPITYPSNIAEDVTFSEANAKCKELDEDAKVPNTDELASFYCNYRLFDGMENGNYLSSTTATNNGVWIQGVGGGRNVASKSVSRKLRCIKR